MSKRELTAKLVSECLDYDPNTGSFAWKVRPRAHFISDGAWRFWNTKYAGKAALTPTNKGGYKAGRLNGCFLSAHRAAVCCMTGKMPEAEVDHINGNRSDNRWENLRCVSVVENRRNKARYRSNVSGVVGVHLMKRDGVWRAKIGDKRIGDYRCKTAAIIARRSAEINASNFSARHGRPAN